MKWSDLYLNVGTYVSPVYNINSQFEVYENAFDYAYQNNDGSVDVFVRISYDGSTWEPWIKINQVANEAEYFKDTFYGLNNCKFQYKVVLTSGGGVSPVFYNFSASFKGSYVIDNIGDDVCKPELWITKRNSAGTIRLYNETNGQILELANLNKDETVYIDCENEDIVSSLPMVYRYDNHNNEFLQLEVGENFLTGEGDFELSIRHEFKLLQG